MALPNFVECYQVDVLPRDQDPMEVIDVLRIAQVRLTVHRSAFVLDRCAAPYESSTVEVFFVSSRYFRVVRWLQSLE